MSSRLVLLTSAAFALASNCAWAQDATSDDNAIDEIVVTAQHRAESSQRAAVPLDVISSDNLERAGVTSAPQLTTLVPALQISQSGAGAQAYHVRGVGTLTSNSYTDPGVAFNVDGVYIGRPTSVRNTFFDLQRVEVLKGPQGTLYGRNATGGAINVIPMLPQIGETSGYIGATFGNYNELGFEGALNLPTSVNSALRISATSENRDGYLSDNTNDADSYAVRAQWLLEPSNEVSIRISGDYSHEGGRGNGAVINGYLDSFTLAPVLGPVERDIGLSDPATSAIFSGLYSFPAGRFGQGVADVPRIDSDFWGVRGEVDWSTSLGDLTVIAAHRESELNNLDFGVGFPAYTDQTDEQSSLEVRLASPDEGMFRWLLGAYYYQEDIESQYNFNVTSLTSFQDLETSTESTAVFGRLTFAPTDALRFVAGVRVTRDEKSFDGVDNVFRVICTNPVFPFNTCAGAPLFPFAADPDQLIGDMGLINVGPGAYISLSAPAATIYLRRTTSIDQTIEETQTTWRAAVEYDVGPRSLLYASVETGYHLGGFSFSSTRPSFDPELVTAYTIGSKNRFFDGALQANVEAFLWQYRDQQVTHFAADTVGNLAYITENAGESTNQGVELSLIYRPLANTTLNADVQYLHAEYDEFRYRLPQGATAPPPVTACPLTPVSATEVEANCAGFVALHAPEWTINAGIEQVFPLGGGYELIANLDTHYQTENVVGFEMLPGLSTQDAYMMTNFALTLEPQGAQWSATVFVNNIEDEHVIGQSFFNNQFNTFAASPLPPQTYGARIRVNW